MKLIPMVYYEFPFYFKSHYSKLFILAISAPLVITHIKATISFTSPSRVSRTPRRVAVDPEKTSHSFLPRPEIESGVQSQSDTHQPPSFYNCANGCKNKTPCKRIGRAIKEICRRHLWNGVKGENEESFKNKNQKILFKEESENPFWTTP